MTYIHIGNNVYYGTDRNEIPTPSKNSVFTNVLTGDISIFGTNAWTTTSYGGKDDKLVFQVTRQVPLTNIGTTYIDIFGAFYDGYPQGIDTNGYTTMGMIMLWQKNGGTGIHDLRVVNAANPSQVLVHTEDLRVINGAAQDGLKNGTTKSYNIAIPPAFENFRGEVKLQAKSTVATDDPIFDACNLYLIR